MGGRVVRTVASLITVFVAAVLVITWMIARRGAAGMTAPIGITAVFAPLLALLFMVPTFLYERSRVARFRIADNCLEFGGKSYPLQGVIAVARDPEVMSWAFKLVGNGGLGAIRGRYWSKRIGAFQAFLTDPGYAVVLRWPDRVVAVSPSDPEYFITCAKSAAGIR